MSGDLFWLLMAAACIVAAVFAPAWVAAILIACSCCYYKISEASGQ